MNPKIFLIALGVFVSSVINAQNVGINTKTPKATLDVAGKPSETAKPDGVIAPRLKRSELIAKSASYGADQNGAIIYVTDLSGTTNTATAAVTSAGYYYFDGNKWNSLGSASVEAQFVRVERKQSSSSAQLINPAAATTDYSSAVVVDLSKGNKLEQGITVSVNKIVIPTAGVYEIEFIPNLSALGEIATLFYTYIGNGSTDLAATESSIKVGLVTTAKYIGSFAANTNIDFRIGQDQASAVYLKGFYVSVKKL